MRRRVREGVVAMVATGLLVPSAFGACLLEDYSVPAEYTRSKVVVLGRVTAEQLVRENEAQGLLDGTVYTVRVQEVFRGQPSRVISVFSENSSSRFPMEKGQTYILFLYSQSGRLSADYCGNSGMASVKQSVVNAVRGLAHER